MKKRLLFIGALTASLFVSAQNLIEHYSFDYASFKGVNGTGSIYNGWPTADKNSAANGAVKFNGENQASLGNPTIDATNGFSISFWYNPSSAMTGTANHFVLSKRATCSAGNQLNIIANPSAGTLGISVRVDAPAPIFQASTFVTVTSDTWQHITFVFDNTTRRVLAYKNGVLTAFASYTGTAGTIKEFAPSTDLMLATSPCVNADGSVRFKGALDELKLYSSTLNATQVTADYAAVISAPVNPNYTLEDLKIYDDKMEIACSKNSKNAIVIGAATTSNRNGDLNSAIQFNGTSSAVDAKRVTSENPLGNLISNNSSLAISAWVKLSATEANGFIASNYAGTNTCGNSGAQKGFIFRVVANKLNAYVTIGTGQYQVSTNATISNGTWHHVVVNYTQPLQSINDFEFYIDGVLAPHTMLSGNTTIPATGSFIAPSSNPTSFGGSIAVAGTICLNEYSLSGALDDVKIFKGKLTPNQIVGLGNVPTNAFVEPAGDVTSDLVLAETFNLYTDSLDFAAKYQSKYSGISFTADRFGNSNSAMLFNANNAYVNANVNLNNVVADNDPFTYSVWLRPDDLMSNNMILGHAGDGGCNENQRQQYFRMLDGKVNFTATFTNTANTTTTYYRSVSGSTLLFPGTWYHVVVTVNQPINSDNDIEIYINGVKESVTSTGTGAGYLPTNNSKLTFGNYLNVAGSPCNSAQDPSFKGALDDIRIFDRLLCPSDISSLYTEESPTITGFISSNRAASSSILYPNPVTGAELNLTQSGAWILTNTIGEILSSGSSNVVDVSNLKSGMYFISLTNENGIVTSTFLKQ